MLGLGACSRSDVAAEAVQPPPTRQAIWEVIQPRCAQYRIDPLFVYALVAAESNFDPRAKNGSACGLLQLMPAAWRAVSSEPFEPTVWNWRKNLETGIDYLAYTRSTLHLRGVYSQPLMLAAFHYGLGYVEERKYAMSRIECPPSPIYRALWAGQPPPITAPGGQER